MSVEFVVRHTVIACDDFVPEYTDYVFETEDAATSYLIAAFDECDDVRLFQRDVVSNDIPF